MTELEALQAKLEAAKQKTKEEQAKREEAAKIARLKDEIAAQEAFGQACADHGDGRVLPMMRIEGGGFVVVRWPDKPRWTAFVNRGILKSDKLTAALCEEAACSGLVYPDQTKFSGYLSKNPNAAIVIVERLIKAMRPEDEEEGKG